MEPDSGSRNPDPGSRMPDSWTGSGTVMETSTIAAVTMELDGAFFEGFLFVREGICCDS